MPLGRRDLLIVATLALTGCVTGERPSFSSVEDVPLGPLPSIEGTITIGSVVIIGDSITAAAAGAIRALLVSVGLDRVTIDAVPSRRIVVGNGKGQPLNGAKTLEQLLAAGNDPDAWVIALGTNDVGAYADDAAYAEIIDQMLTQIPRSTPLVWVDTYLPARLQATNQFNSVLTGLLKARGNAVVASWFDVASRPDAGLLRTDQVHPNAAGVTAFALVVANGLARLI